MPRPVLALALVLSMPAGCSEPRATVVELAELVPVSGAVVATESVDLGDPGDEDHLVGGWAHRPYIGEARGRLVIGREAVLWFDSVALDDTTLEIELNPFQPAGTPPRRIALAVNGDRLGARQLDGGWNDLRFEVPASMLVPGRNELQLRFSHAPRPSEHLRRSRDDRRIAALVRKVSFRPPTGRTVWATTPPGVEWSEGERSTVTLPTDSLADLYLEVPSGARLTGEVVFEAAPEGRGGTARFEVKLAADGSEESSLLERILGSGGAPETLDVGLGEWAGEIVRIRLRVIGEVNGRIVGSGLRIIAPARIARALPEQLPRLAEPPRSGRLGRPDVFVILLDAARADAFSCYGSAWETPAVDGLAARGTRFVRAYSPSSWTGQSIPPLLTGRYPDATGSEVWGSPLPEEVPTLAELLADAGYHTALWSQHTLYRGNATLRRGFRAVHVTERGVRNELPTLDELRDPDDPDRPVFALVHLLPPHGGYFPPREFRGTLTSWYEGGVPLSSKMMNEFPERRNPSEISAEDVRFIRLRYQENVLFADHLVGRILSLLREADRLDDSVVFLVSDHGEGFMEHGYFLHTSTLFEEMVRIPFVVQWPSGIGGFVDEVESPVGLVDVAPTIVDGLGLVSGDAAFQGRSLLGAASGADGLDRPVYALSRRGTMGEHRARWIFALFQDGWKLIHDKVEGSVRLYDLQSDPGESRDLAEALPIRSGFLLQRLLRIRRYNLRLDPEGPARGEDPELDPEVLEELRALGYLR